MILPLITFVEEGGVVANQGVFFKERLPLVAGATCRTWATVLLLAALAAFEPALGALVCRRV